MSLSPAPAPAYAPASAIDSPRRATQGLLCLYVTGLCSRCYGLYNQALKADSSVWTRVLDGTSTAPEQYRVGVVFCAAWLGRGLHLRLSQAFGLLDLAGALLAALLLYSALERSPAYAAASPRLRWFGSAAFLALAFYLLDWTLWYPKVATLPTAGLVALSLWLWTPGPSSSPITSSRRSPLLPALLAAALLTVSFLLALVRAEASVCINLGVFAAALLGWSPRLALRRGVALAVSLAGAALAAATQLFLARVVYPRATYADVPVLMLLHDYRALNLWASCLLFLAPFLWTLRRALQVGVRSEGPGAGFLLAGIAWLGLWLLLGRLDEVRIFLPIALACVPLSVALALGRLHPDPAP
jgi:hypothetical protein